MFTRSRISRKQDPSAPAMRNPTPAGSLGRFQARERKVDWVWGRQTRLLGLSRPCLGILGLCFIGSLAPVLAPASVAELGAGSAATRSLPTDAELNGRAIAVAMNQRNEGRFKSQRVEMTLRSARGKSRQQVAMIFRSTSDDSRKSVLFYQRPAEVRGTGFLTYDYHDPTREDDQWLYLPSLRRTRRVAAADRGDWFMGTDLTYEEIKKDGKFELEDSNWHRQQDSEVDGHSCYLVEASVKSPQLAKELGHYSARIWVDRESLFPRRIEYRDQQGRRLRTVHTSRLERIDGVWTALVIEVTHHAGNTSTLFEMSEVDYQTELGDATFSQSQLRRGRP